MTRAVNHLLFSFICFVYHFVVYYDVLVSFGATYDIYMLKNLSGNYKLCILLAALDM